MRRNPGWIAQLGRIGRLGLLGRHGRLWRRGLLGLLAALAASPRAAAQETYEFAGSSWSFAAADLRLRLDLEGSPRSTEKALLPATLSFGEADGQLLLDGLPLLAGPLEHAVPTRRRVELLPDDAAVLGAWLETRLVALAGAQGLLAGGLEAQFDSARVRMKLAIHRADLELSGRLSLQLRASGTLLAAAEGRMATPLAWKAKLRLRGNSERQPFSRVLVVPVDEQEPPSADFAMNTFIGEAPLVVTFHSTSSGTISQHAWDFGDGAGTGFVHPVYVFETPGTYVVTLTVTGPLGSDEHSRFVTALDPPPLPGPGPPPRMNLYPAEPGDPDGVGSLEKVLGAGSMFYVGMTPGFAWGFTGVLDADMNAAEGWTETLFISCDIEQHLTSRVRLKRLSGELLEIFPEQQLVVGLPSSPQIEFFSRSVNFPATGAELGDRIVWEIWNTAASAPGADLRIHLDRSRLRVPKY